MLRRLPQIKTGNSILIVCEGSEEYDYLEALKKCGVWSNKLSIKLKNAKSINNILSQYQYEFANDNYDLIVVFCDTEVPPYDEFINLKKAINEFHGKEVAEKIVFFTNPCSMQIILSHFNRVNLKSNSKTINSTLIQKLTGVKDYIATENQRTSIMKKINAKNYEVMKQNVAGLSSKCDKVPSTNILELFEQLEKNEGSWIQKLKEEIDS